MLPTDSSNEATIAAYIFLSSDEKRGNFYVQIEMT